MDGLCSKNHYFFAINSITPSTAASCAVLCYSGVKYYKLNEREKQYLFPGKIVTMLLTSQIEI